MKVATYDGDTPMDARAGTAVLVMIINKQSHTEL